MKKRNNSVILSGLLVLAAQPLSAFAMHHGAAPHAAATSHAPAAHRPAPGHHGGAPHPVVTPAAPAHHNQPSAPAHHGRPPAAAYPTQPSGPAHHAPAIGHVPGSGHGTPSIGHVAQPSPGHHGGVSEGRRPWGGRPAVGARRVWGHGAFGGHTRYMPPHHRHYAHMNFTPGWMYPIVGYPGFYMYNNVWVYRANDGLCYDEGGNQVSVEADAQVGADIDVEVSSGCC